MLEFARWTIADRYLPRPQRGVALADLADLCRTLLARPAGADADGMRLVAGCGLIDSASHADEVTMLRSWLEARGWPGGLGDAAFPASLRRLLADRLDDLRRALKVR